MKYKSLAFLGFPDYRISDVGTVQSRRVYGSKLRRIGPWWTMKLKTRKGYGHPYIDLFREVGKPERFGIHVLVALAFIGPRPEGKIACHKDDVPTNNVPDNIYWGTNKTNMKDAIRNGKIPMGEKVYNAKFTNEQVREIRKQAAEGMKGKDIAKLWNIRKTVVSKIVLNQIYKSV